MNSRERCGLDRLSFAVSKGRRVWWCSAWIFFTYEFFSKFKLLMLLQIIFLFPYSFHHFLRGFIRILINCANKPRRGFFISSHLKLHFSSYVETAKKLKAISVAKWSRRPAEIHRTMSLRNQYSWCVVPHPHHCLAYLALDITSFSIKPLPNRK